MTHPYILPTFRKLFYIIFNFVCCFFVVFFYFFFVGGGGGGGGGGKDGCMLYSTLILQLHSEILVFLSAIGLKSL